MTEKPQSESDLEKLADSGEPSLVAEFVEFLRDNKKWWLVPILLILGICGIAAFLATNSAIAPFDSAHD